MRVHPVVVFTFALSGWAFPILGRPAMMMKSEGWKPQVELLEAGRHAGDVLLALVQALDVLERVAEDLADRQCAALEATLGEAEDPAFGVVDQRLDVFLGLECLRDDVARGLDQLAEHRHVPHDRGVRVQIRGDRSLLDQERQRGGSADQLELLAAAQLLGQGQDVDRLAVVEEREHALIDQTVRFGVEVRRLEELDHPGQGLAPLEEDRAQHGALGVQVVRRDSRRDFETTHRRKSPRTIAGIVTERRRPSIEFRRDTRSVD
jgi:hypothetical protein